MARRNTVRPSRVRNLWQKARDKMLIDADCTKTDVHKLCEKRGVPIAKSSVFAVLDGRYRNEDVIRAFCDLTKVDERTAFPDDEPPFRGDVEPPKRTMPAQSHD